MRTIGSENIADYAARLLAATAEHPLDRLVQCEFRLPFLDVTARFSDLSFAQICRNGLARRGTVDSRAKASIEISVMSSTSGLGFEPAIWQEPSFSPVNFDRIITGRQLRGYYHHEHRFWQFYDPASRRGIQAMMAPDRYPPWESSGPLRAFLHWAYDDLGMRLAHAATLGCAGRGVLLAGSGGSGKSGTTLAGIAHGLQSVGDDYVLLDRGPTRYAHAIFSRMKQDVAGLKRVSVDVAQLRHSKPNWQHKIEFDPREIRQDAFTDRMEIVGILLPKIAHRSRTAIEPARPVDAMLALAPSGLFQMPGCAASGVRFFSDLARRTPVFHLNLSENPAEIAGAVRRFLDKQEMSCAG